MHLGRDRVNILAIGLLIIAALLYTHLFQARGPSGIGLRYPSSTPLDFDHPIDRLIWEGHQQVNSLRQHAVHDAKAAAQAYRARRGRHPPPQFDKWVEFAVSHKSPINEEFFDQIYEDLDPFWGVDASELRHSARTYDGSYSIRNGKARFRISKGGGHNSGWVKLWSEAFLRFEKYLPDLDFAVNNVDEPRIIVPWEEMAEYMKKSAATKHVRPSTDADLIENSYTKYSNITEDPTGGYKESWDAGGEFWHKARMACHPDSVARNSEAMLDTSSPPKFDNIKQEPYVRNFTNARDACQQPHIHNFHASYIKPGSSSTSQKLFPLFSACKLTGISNDILLPAAMYFNKDLVFSGGDKAARQYPWRKKRTKAFWRGSPTGGVSDESNWRYFQRQRLVSIMNSTTISYSEKLHPFSSSSSPIANPLTAEAKALLLNQTGDNIPIPSIDEYPLAALKTTPTSLGTWLSSFQDGKFSTLVCRLGSPCDFMFPYYHEVRGIPLPEMFKFKYLPDADGMSYSGRYHSFLRSTSVPLKATVYSEWHDSRLIPWFHFVPLDVTYRDWYGIMEYFVGYDPAGVDGVDGNDKSLFRRDHDEEAKNIALQGLNWSQKALRQADMIVYMYRLLLEWARICDERRERMGWTGDL